MAIAEDLEVASFLKGGPKKLFIGGRWVEAAGGETFETIDPATGEVLARVAEGRAEDIDRAVASARRSFNRGTWRELPPAERAKVTPRSEEHTSELQSHHDLVCRLLLEKKKKI